MDNRDDIAKRVRDAIMSLPAEQQTQAIHGLIGSLIKGMSVAGILEMRKEIAQQFETDIPIVQSTLDLIDGHLELRKIGGSDGWR